MASVGLPNNSKVYIFGGFDEEKYADANITVLNYWLSSVINMT